MCRFESYKEKIISPVNLVMLTKSRHYEYKMFPSTRYSALLFISLPGEHGGLVIELRALEQDDKS